MTGHVYRDVILEQHVCLFRGVMGAEFLFMDVNARSHRANIVEECLQSENIIPRICCVPAVAEWYWYRIVDCLVTSSSPVPFKISREGQRCTLNLSRAEMSSRCDEVHFCLNGYVNKQNCRFWSEANPQVYVETPLRPEKLTVWCALWAGGIIGPYFFKNDEGHNVTVNGDWYRSKIINFFIPELNNHYVQELWFQQDGATCHTARAKIDLLKDTFGDHLISRFGPVNWPPRSCDLTPLDYFLWGYVKSLVYADRSQTLDHLEDIIHRVIGKSHRKLDVQIGLNPSQPWQSYSRNHKLKM
ncbi:putative DD41D transposase [Trichonephila clavipes]|nr:putative DD41D transposase [Trichonephila clavipes]